MAYNPGQELSSLAFDKIIGGALDAVVKAQNNSSMTTVSFIKTVGFKKSETDSVETPVYVDFKYPKEIAPFKAAEKTVTLNIVKGGTNYDASATSFYIDDKKIDVNLEVVDGVIKSAQILNATQVSSATDQTAVVIKTENKEDSEGGNGAEARLVVISKAAVLAQIQEMTLQVPLLTMMPIPFIRIESTDIEFNVKINSVNTTSVSEDSNTEIKSNTTAGFKSWWSPVSVNTSFNASFATQKKSSSTEEVKKEFSLNIKVHAVQDEMPAGVSKVLDILEGAIVAQPVAK